MFKSKFGDSQYIYPVKWGGFLCVTLNITICLIKKAILIVIIKIAFYFYWTSRSRCSNVISSDWYPITALKKASLSSSTQIPSYLWSVSSISWLTYSFLIDGSSIKLTNKLISKSSICAVDCKFWSCTGFNVCLTKLAW